MQHSSRASEISAEGFSHSGRVVAVLVAPALLLSVALWTAAARAAGANGGATTINPTSGGSHTQFKPVLPAGAACSGDTPAGFKVFSFLVPAGTDLTTLTYNGQGPSAGTPLYDIDGSDYTARATNPGDGRVVGLPFFNFASFSNDGATGDDSYLALPYGDYLAGIACAKGDGSEDKYWNVALTFSAAATTADANGETWAVTGSQVTTTTATTAPTTTTTGLPGATTTSTAVATTTTTSTEATTDTTEDTTDTTVADEEDPTTTTTKAMTTTTTASGGSVSGTSDATSTSTLPRTGAPSAWEVLGGIVALYAGLVLFLSGRQLVWRTWRDRRG